jgi:hypothetical protein
MACVKWKIQTFFTTPKIHFFVVNMDLAVPPQDNEDYGNEGEDDYYHNLITAHLPSLPVQPYLLATEARMKTLVEKFTDWNLHLERFITNVKVVESVQSLIQMPKKDKPMLFEMKKAVRMWIEKGKEVCNQVPYLAKKILKDWPL